MTEDNKSTQDTSVEKAEWYVVHTYSGYENKVKANVEKIVENRGMEDQIMEVSVPMEEVVEIKNGQKKIVQRKIFPGYVIVKMIMTDESWYIIRNARGVTGFVGPGSKPIPLTEDEIRRMGVENLPVRIDVEVGDNIRVINGPLENFIGIIKSIDMEKQIMSVSVSMFGRDTPVDLQFDQVQKI